MINVVIIDDEENCRDTLTLRLNKNHQDIRILGTADSARTGEEIIRKHKPDIVFLDIEMPDNNGFSILEQFDKIDFEVIMTTAYDSYMMTAIKFNVLDYLFKPVDNKQLDDALNKYRKKYADNSGQLKTKAIQSSDQSYKLLLPASFGFELVKIETILYCIADRNYTEVFLTGNKKILVSRPLKEFEQELNDFQFFRIHQSFLVNMNHIAQYNKSSGGFLVMADGKKLSISKNKKDEFIKFFRRI